MIHKKFRKGTAVFCAILLLGVTACKAEGNRPRKRENGDLRKPGERESKGQQS